jgi:sporulation protein YlmC with PRC-barrel domain
MRLSDESLRGRTVIAADGLVVGQIATVFIDSATWRIESLLIKLRDEVADQIGTSHNIFQSGTLDLPVQLVQSVGDAVVLSVPALRLRDVLQNVGGASTAL